jgi:hypothetical protein
VAKLIEDKMPALRSPMINLYSRHLSRAVAFYSKVGFIETFRTPATRIAKTTVTAAAVPAASE